MPDGTHKTPRSRFSPRDQKQPKSVAQPEEPDKFLWSFSQFDNWCFCKQDDRNGKRVVCEFQDIARALGNLESQGWKAICANENRNHPIERNLLVKEAQQRLTHCHLDDYEKVWSLHTDGKHRLWGLKDGNVFLVVWWDPYHRVCPSRKG